MTEAEKRTSPDERTTIPWWESRAVIGAMVTVAASLAGIAGYTVDIGETTEIMLTFATLIGGLLGWWGRVMATRAISRTRVLPGVTVGKSK